MADTAAVTMTNEAGSGALCRAIERLLSPLARLCLAHGILFAKAEEMLKSAFVRAARDLQRDIPQHGLVSRISAATGINRREVTRLVGDKASRRNERPSLASEVIARWTAEPVYRAASGEALVLRRQGDAPSFEYLARSITRDMHPRSILEELLRLGIVGYDAVTDQVALRCDEYVPGDGQGERMAFLGDNVGDHLESAVANLLRTDIQHHDQAIFADELSDESVKKLAPLIREHWCRLRDDLVPALTACIEADREAGRPQNQRVRIGLYSFSEEDDALRHGKREHV